jgi:hypothetical protein
MNIEYNNIMHILLRQHKTNNTRTVISYSEILLYYYNARVVCTPVSELIYSYIMYRRI